MNLSEINKLIAELSEEERNNVSDWYHTFGELYEHRIHLYIALNKYIWRLNNIRKDECDIYDTEYEEYISPKKSKKHFDWSEYEWWFILQITTPFWQISYHLPNKYRDSLEFVKTVAIADERDWHTSQDVLDRLLLV